MENIKEKSVGQIVAEDYRAAKVFENHRIDFCCNGGRKIQDVAAEIGIDLSALEEEITKATEGSVEEQNDFESWPLDLLSDYIVKTHHKRAEAQIQQLIPYLDKVTQVHGGRHPELIEIKNIFMEIAGEMARHMKKEEIMLFPFIKKMLRAKENGEDLSSTPMQSIEDRVALLTHEHDDQGEAFKKIAALSNNFTPPADGCNTYHVTFGQLKECKEDLHKHIHLENNILFPKALQLIEELTA